jgi:uncharacterized membrane protein YgcG
MLSQLHAVVAAVAAVDGAAANINDNAAVNHEAAAAAAVVDNVAAAAAAAAAAVLDMQADDAYMSKWLKGLLPKAIAVPQYIDSLTAEGYTTAVILGLLSPDRLLECIGSYDKPMHKLAIEKALKQLPETTVHTLPKAADYDTVTEYVKALDSKISNENLTTIMNFFEVWGGSDNEEPHHYIELLNDAVFASVAEGRLMKRAYRDLLLTAAATNTTDGDTANTTGGATAGIATANADDNEIDATLPAAASSSSSNSRGTHRQPLGLLPQQRQQQQQQQSDENSNEKASTTADIGGSSSSGGGSSSGNAASPSKRARLQ